MAISRSITPLKTRTELTHFMHVHINLCSHSEVIGSTAYFFIAWNQKGIFILDNKKETKKENYRSITNFAQPLFLDQSALVAQLVLKASFRLELSFFL